jgi:hypothetical protein
MECVVLIVFQKSPIAVQIMCHFFGKYHKLFLRNYGPEIQIANNKRGLDTISQIDQIVQLFKQNESFLNILGLRTSA